MNTKTLNKLFVILIVLIPILLSIIILMGEFEEKESDFDGLKEITGAMQTYEVSHENINLRYKHVRTSERFDDKFFEYLESIQESRDKTFFR